MATHVNSELGVSFTTPDSLTTRQYMACSSLAAVMQREPERALECTFKAARIIIRDWQCKDLPDLNTLDLDEDCNIQHIKIIAWAGNEAMQLITRTNEVPKDSLPTL